MMKIKLAVFAALAAQAAFVGAQMNSSPPDSDYFLPVVNVGSNDTGVAVPFYGCINNGATLQKLDFYANDQWIRGMQATLTDGRQVQTGCVNVNGNATTNNGCSDASIRNSNFTFGSGERITNLTLYPGYNVQGQASQRAGGINITTSSGRTFSFGMANTWRNGTSIDVGNGIPCGVYPKAGADVDTLAFIFLRPVTTSALQSIQYSGVSSGGSGDVSLDVAPLQDSAVQLVLGNQTYNNTGKSTSLVATLSSQAALPTSSQWTSALGLDSYLQAPLNGPVPQIVDYSTSSNSSWSLQNTGLHSRSESSQNEQTYNYTITVGPHGASELSATAIQGNLTATYTASLNVTLDSGASFSIPVSGLYLGVSTSPVHVDVQELAAAIPQSGSSDSGGHSDTVPWVVGVLIGVICGLLLAALLAWAVVLIMRRRNKKSQNTEAGQDPPRPRPRGCLPNVQIPAFFGKGKGVAPEDLQKDVELGEKGKNKWLVDDEDIKKSAEPVYGFPVQSTPKADPKVSVQNSEPHNDELPEAEVKQVLPYNMFRRLRLNSIRQNLNQDASDLTPVSAAQARLERAEERDNLSNPPSGASTPRTIPEVSGRHDHAIPSSEAGAESIEGHYEPDAHQSDKAEVIGDEKVALDEDKNEEPRPLVMGDSQRQRMKDQVAERMAQRRSPTPERPSSRVAHSRSSSVSSPSKIPKVTFMDKISGQIAEYRSQSRVKNPSGLKKNEMQDNAISHGDESLQLGAGYKSTAPSKNLEKNTVHHDDERIKLGVKYETQGRNE